MKMSISRKGRIVSKETRIKISNTLMGHIVSNATKEKMSKRFKGKNLSNEHKRKIGEGNKGKIFSKERKRKISEALKGKKRLKTSGENNPAWRGGVSFEPYGTDWTDDLKESIRKRDNYKCRLCSKENGIKNLHVHHIDYDKTYNDPNNLIALCTSCHMKTGHNRQKWIKLFTKMMKFKIYRVA